MSAVGCPQFLSADWYLLPLAQMLHVPRFFAALRMTSGRRKGKLVTSAAKRLITRMPIKPYDTEKANPVTPLASPLGEEGHEVAKGWTVVRMIMIFLFYVLWPPKGETTHYILRVANAPSHSAVTDSLDFQIADAPLQIQFA